MVLKNKNILVTGSTGLIGSWLIEKLVNYSNVVGIALDDNLDFLIKSKNLSNNFENLYFDICDYEKLKQVFINNNFDIVIHLAAQTQVLDSYNNPLRTFKSNIEGTWNVLDLCKNFETPLVTASSDKAYGYSERLPYIESDELNAIYPYELSKAIGDKLSRSYIETYNTNVTTLRCGNVYGGGDMNWDRLIPGVIKSLLQNQTPILRTKGDYTRDWVYVEDVVSAYIGVAKEVIKKNKNVSAFYNFSSTEYFSVLEIYQELCNIIKKEYIEPIYNLNSDFEIKDQKLDSSKIYKELGIKSNETISSGLKKTVNWYKSNPIT